MFSENLVFWEKDQPICLIFERKVSWQWDSNPQPADYKSAALPIELCQHILLRPTKLTFFDNLIKKTLNYSSSKIEISSTQKTSQAPPAVSSLLNELTQCQPSSVVISTR